MIQDIFPHQLYNQYLPDRNPEASDIVFCFDGSKILVGEQNGKKSLPTVSDFSEYTDLIYLFSLDERRIYLQRDLSNIPSGFSFIEANLLRREAIFPQEISFAVMTGKHLSDWYRDAQFCGRCGTKTEHSKKERAMVCPSCRNTIYPRIMPAVIVGVKNGDKLLLTKYRTGFSHNALIAGFTEIGETAEETVAREVMEEAGVKVKNICYYKSQPWGIANDLLLGYYCDVDGDTEIHMDPNELKYAQWVERNEIQLQPDSFSLTNEMMRMFKEGKEK